MIVQSVAPREVAIQMIVAQYEVAIPMTVAQYEVAIPMTVAHREIVIPMTVALLGQRSLPRNKSRARCMPAQVGVVPKEVVHPLPGRFAKKLNGLTKVL
jgi:hypothetical protein